LASFEISFIEKRKSNIANAIIAVTRNCRAGRGTLRKTK